MGEGQLCRIRGVHCELAVAERWVDAGVRVRGIFSSDINLCSQPVGLKMIVRGPEDAEVLSPAPQNPFSAPRVAHLRSRANLRRLVSMGARAVAYAAPAFVKNGATLEFTYMRSHEARADSVAFTGERRCRFRRVLSCAPAGHKTLKTHARAVLRPVLVAPGPAGTVFDAVLGR